MLYRDLWVNESSPAGGLWVPTAWVRTRFVPVDSDAAALRRAVQVGLLNEKGWSGDGGGGCHADDGEDGENSGDALVWDAACA